MCLKALHMKAKGLQMVNADLTREQDKVFFYGRLRFD